MLKRPLAPRPLAALAVALLLASMLPATATAAEFRLVGSFLDTADLSEAPGGGIGVSFPFGQGQWAFDIAAYYFEDFENRFEDVDSFKIELSTFPIDLGARYRQNGDAGGWLAGAGLSALIVDPDRADGDDQEGAYVMVGYQTAGGFTVEVLYRDADIMIENVEFPGLGDLEFELDMSGYQINIGYSF